MGLEEVFKELNGKVTTDLSRFRPNNICDRLQSLQKKGNDNRTAKNYKDAYVYYKRWLMIADWLQKQKGMDAESKKKFSPLKKKEIEKLFQGVVECIKREHEFKQTTNEQKTQNFVSHSDDDISFKLPEVPSEEPRPKRHDEITCSELFQLLKPNNEKENRVLIFDIRKDEDYLNSRISFQKKTIHIPAHKIEPNKVSAVYRSMILHDKQALELFNKRGEQHTDVVVLVDNSSSVDTMKSSSPIALFKKSLENFDHAADYKRIAVLKGGFEEWSSTYPDFVWRYQKKKTSSLNSDSLCDILNDSNYDYLSPKKSIESTPSPILSGNHSVGRAVYPKLTPLSTPTSQTTKKKVSFNGVHDPSQNGISDKQLLKSNNIMESKVLINKLPEKPIVDRTNKPTSGKKISTPTLSKEELEKKLQDVQLIRSQMSKHRENDDWSKEQCDIYCKLEEELLADLKKLNPSLSTESTKLYPDLSKMSIGPKKQVSATPKVERENKENIQMPKEVEIKTEPCKFEPPSTPPVQEMDIDDEDIYAPPCKDNQPMGSGLKRSISSPNLASQKDAPKAAPLFDRSTKPKDIQNNRPIIMPPYRERNFDAVESSSVHPGITGLKNLGNSCYMNSIIQCLSNTDYLAKYFNNSVYVNDLNRNSDKGVTVAEEVAQVVKALWRGLYKSISPRDLKAVVGLYRLQFESYEQQDSHEFLMFLLDWMHNDLKQRKVSYGYMSAAEKEWEKSMNGQSSIISKLFFGQLRSTIECLHCHKNSTTYETFNSLTLSLPSSSRCTLDECVKRYVDGQKVTGWKCPSCEVPRDGTKKFDISKLPHIIVIHLNRFHFTDTGSWLEKKNTAVEFPLTNLDLGPYLVKENSINNSRHRDAYYNLYAMSNHYGTMEGGHYTAYCKSNTQSKWYKYDDHTVTEVQPSTVRNQSNSAYLLFYSSVNAEPYLNS